MNFDSIILTRDQMAEIWRIVRDKAASPFEQMIKGKLMYDPMFMLEFSRSVDKAKLGASPRWVEESSVSQEPVTRELIQKKLAAWQRVIVRDRVVENIRKTKLSIEPNLP